MGCFVPPRVASRPEPVASCSLQSARVIFFPKPRSHARAGSAGLVLCATARQPEPPNPTRRSAALLEVRSAAPLPSRWGPRANWGDGPCEANLRARAPLFGVWGNLGPEALLQANLRGAPGSAPSLPFFELL
jgi:hypothetical protein